MDGEEVDNCGLITFIVGFILVFFFFSIGSFVLLITDCFFFLSDFFSFFSSFSSLLN